MNILGIDPGTEKSGWVMWKSDTMSVIRSGIDPNQQIINEHLDCPYWDAVVIEAPEPLGMPLGHDLLQAIQWQTRMVCAAEQAAGLYGEPVVQIKRSEVKLHTIGKRNGTDAEVNASIRGFLCRHHDITEKDLKGRKKSPGPCHGIKSHSWAALAAVIAAGGLGHIVRNK